MLKGVNKQIIEVNHPENDCFEKVILFLKNDCDFKRPLFDRQCSEYIGSLNVRLRRQTKVMRALRITALLGISAGAGALLMWGIITFAV